jgi:negative regulator of sigma-B (phosphoserine phosphatase)
VLELPGGALAVAMDGLGHGAAAQVAAEAARRSLVAGARAPLHALVAQCHRDLHKTRGVALSLAFFDVGQGAMTWLGVGNVEGVLVRAAGHVGPARESLLLRGGVVGYRLPPLRVATLPVGPNDTLIFATDGIRGQFARAPAAGTPQEIADDLLARFCRGTDDALVLVVRYLGGVA